MVAKSIWHPEKLASHLGVTCGYLAELDDTTLFGDRVRFWITPASR